MTGHVPWTPRAARVRVELGDRSYDVHIGAVVRHKLAEIVAGVGAQRAVIVSARPPACVPDPGVPYRLVEALDGERHKTLETVAILCGHFARAGLNRGDVVISCGGGTTTDTTGLAAALYHRGIPVIHLPTSLLAQVAASAGGKPAVNLPEGKNLVGAVWQPRAVLCDTDYLATLPSREWINGYGEIARCHFIGAGDLRHRPVAEQIRESVRTKAEIGSEDERDEGRRHLLNYGHTLGHALELETGFALRHGEAVAVGTVFAGRLAGALGRISQVRVDLHVEVVGHYGLPWRLPVEADVSSLISLMRLDKKAHGDLAFVLDGPRGAELVHDVPEQAVLDCLERMPRSHEGRAAG